MLVLLSTEDIDRQRKSALHTFPAQLLRLVAAHPASRERQLALWLQAWFPLPVEGDELIQSVARSLEWYLREGHIQRELGGRYTCLPAYALGGTTELSGQAQLYGDPRIEGLLREQGIAVEEHVVYDTLANSDRTAVGHERTFHVTALQKERLVERGVAFFGAEDLRNALPQIEMLVEPNPSDAHPPNLTGGIWQVYEPHYRGQDPWHTYTVSDKITSRLVRWLPSDDRFGYFGRRYFYSLYYGAQVIPISVDQAILWELWTDVERQLPRQVFWNVRQGYLCVPLGLPRIIWQWLRLATLSRPVRIERYWRLSVDQQTVATLRQVFETNLGLEWVEALSPNQT